MNKDKEEWVIANQDGFCMAISAPIALRAVKLEALARNMSKFPPPPLFNPYDETRVLQVLHSWLPPYGAELFATPMLGLVKLFRNLQWPDPPTLLAKEVQIEFFAATDGDEKYEEQGAFELEFDVREWQRAEFANYAPDVDSTVVSVSGTNFIIEIGIEEGATCYLVGRFVVW